MIILRDFRVHLISLSELLLLFLALKNLIKLWPRIRAQRRQGDPRSSHENKTVIIRNADCSIHRWYLGYKVSWLRRHQTKNVTTFGQCYYFYFDLVYQLKNFSSVNSKCLREICFGKKFDHPSGYILSDAFRIPKRFTNSVLHQNCWRTYKK